MRSAKYLESFRVPIPHFSMQNAILEGARGEIDQRKAMGKSKSTVGGPRKGNEKRRTKQVPGVSSLFQSTFNSPCSQADRIPQSPGHRPQYYPPSPMDNTVCYILQPYFFLIIFCFSSTPGAPTFKLHTLALRRIHRRKYIKQV